MSAYRREFFKKLGALFTSGMASKPVSASPSFLVQAASTSQAQRFAQAEQEIKADYDLIVVGGGISGTSGAISAARNGLRVALVHERSMLGGNSSSEVKLFPENNSGFHPWIKEGGIHEEFHTEERARNHQATSKAR